MSSVSFCQNCFVDLAAVSVTGMLRVVSCIRAEVDPNAVVSLDRESQIYSITAQGLSLEKFTELFTMNVSGDFLVSFDCSLGTTETGIAIQVKPKRTALALAARVGDLSRKLQEITL